MIHTQTAKCALLFQKTIVNIKYCTVSGLVWGKGIQITIPSVGNYYTKVITCVWVTDCWPGYIIWGIVSSSYKKHLQQGTSLEHRFKGE